MHCAYSLLLLFPRFINTYNYDVIFISFDYQEKTEKVPKLNVNNYSVGHHFYPSEQISWY
jgi:hypothetical protein